MKKILLQLLPVLLVLAIVRATHAAGTMDDPAVAAARAADEERIAATKSGERARLDAIFSDQLRYGHASGKVDTKASYVQSLVTRSTVYESFDYKQRDFLVAGPGIVIMTGRVLIKATNNGERADNDLNFLAVWRLENGKWRFLEWQSCKYAPPAPPAKT
jgi:hypothetical protein